MRKTSSLLAIVFKTRSAIHGAANILRYVKKFGVMPYFSLMNKINFSKSFFTWLPLVYKFRTQVQWASVKSELQFSGILGLFQLKEYA